LYLKKKKVFLGFTFKEKEMKTVFSMNYLSVKSPKVQCTKVS